MLEKSPLETVRNVIQHIESPYIAPAYYILKQLISLCLILLKRYSKLGAICVQQLFVF
jgi:hypothetical protein